ncbi:MAG: hypothetical protein HQL37_15235 [Alphaproteobacteria bacterium]|nr:hypothetical protein [Alphaproteobacteria bacterium]
MNRRSFIAFAAGASVAVAAPVAAIFTFKRALHIVLTAELVRIGLSAKTASLHATNFTDIGEAVT